MLSVRIEGNLILIGTQLDKSFRIAKCKMLGMSNAPGIQGYAMFEYTESMLTDCFEVIRNYKY